MGWQAGSGAPAGSTGQAEVTTVAELIERLNENPPEHYKPTRSFWETLWELEKPARLIYPTYTRARMNGKTAAAKRWRG